jgi:hypothetical protein
VNEARRKKLRVRVAINPKAVRFEDLIRLIEAYGYKCEPPGGGSSHHVCRAIGRSSFNVAKPKAKHVKAVYVKIALSQTEDLEDA